MRSPEDIETHRRPPAQRHGAHSPDRADSGAFITYGTDDKPLGGRAVEIERVARYQRQRPYGRGVQHRDVLRVDDPRSLDAIDVRPLECVELDPVARGNVLQSPEEA